MLTFGKRSIALLRHFQQQPKRNASTSSKATQVASKLRNIALVAHIDSGKTTLTESILYKSSYLSSYGTVDTGSTTTDFLPTERERGITIQSASIPVQWKQWTFNLIDTPGHADFGMEVESASRVVDGAVVLIDSVEGVEAQTKGVWRQLDRYGVSSRIIFANKMDRTGANFAGSVSSVLANHLHPRPLVLTLPVASFDAASYSSAEPGIEGIIDLIKWEVWKWDKSSGGKHQVIPLPRTLEGLETMNIFPPNHPISELLVPARQKVLETLSMLSDDLMEQLLADSSGTYLSLSPDDIIPSLRAATIANEVVPVICGSAVRHIGTDIVLDYVGELFSSPVDMCATPQNGSSPMHAFVWKVGWDERKGWMTFVRIYSGTLQRKASLLNVTRGKKETISKILLLYANDHKEVDTLPFGSVGVIPGLKHSRPGDTLVLSNASTSSHPDFLDMVPPPPVMSASVLPASVAESQAVLDALHSLIRTDPSIRVDQQEGQILIHGLGALHLEIVEGRLRDEFKAKFEIGRRYVSFRETLAAEMPTKSASWSTSIGARNFDISMTFSLRPLRDDEPGNPLWDGNVVVDEKNHPLPSPDSMQESAKAYIARGIASALSSSPHSSLAMTHVHVRLERFSSVKGPNLSILSGASSYILRQRLKEAGMGPLLEPYVHMRITIPESCLGPLVKDLTERGGVISELGSTVAGSSVDGQNEYASDGLYIPPVILSPSGITSTETIHPQRRQAIDVLAPLSRMLDYNNRLRALSGGHGHFEMTSAGFRTVAGSRREEILKEIGRA